MLCLAVLALAAFVIACIGVGQTTLRLIAPSADPSFAPLTGCAVFIWVSTILNAAGIFHTGALMILIGGGTTAFAQDWRRRRKLGPASTGWLLPLAILTVVISLVVFLPPEFNLNDDGPAYLLFSEKLRLLGASGPEPFSERRLYGLGGQFGLVALVRGFFEIRWLSLYEPGLGLALIGTTLMLRDRATPDAAAVRIVTVMAVALVSLMLWAKPIANLAPALLYAAMLFGAVLAWLKVMAQPEDGGAMISLALLCAIALTLRPTALVFIALLALTGGFAALRARRLADLGRATALAVIILAPSMLASWQASGTAFFPFLGLGVHAPMLYLPTTLGEVVAGIADEPAGAILLVGVLGLTGCLAWRRDLPKGGVLLAVLVVVAYVGVAWPTAGEKLSRYSFPLLFAVLCALALHIRIPPLRPGRSVSIAAGGFAVASVIALSLLPAQSLVLSVAPDRLAARWRQPAFDPAVTREWRAAQDALPPDATLLSVAGRYTGLMNVRRNSIFAADQPGTAGPNGGWPIDPHSSRDWLRRSGIDYLLIDDAAMTPPPPGDTAWKRGRAQAASLAATQLRAATAGVLPVSSGDGFAIYAVADLNPR